ncbi:hypothetical protein BE04_20770 [Sorangium cellulosum]|uniref:Uncharacterized protein n=2 Tax=Sorangium cellulosum TaxID=56 RepID=A0A150TQY3_SORCE|nr:hypothetical protein SCE1572_07520 [Sorangium cellulosum So0157-2]KYF50738.1 hypothetical protein BE04_20770 [Sorangium cellulosum]KYG06997.1 hypothetical protein BE21_31615 [Sorangium cellulosum]
MSLEVRDRKGKLVRTVVVPEARLVAFLKALDSVGGQGLGPIDLYGDTTLSHERCKLALDSCRQALASMSEPDAVKCGEAIVGVVAEVAANASRNLFVIGN